MNEWVWHLQDPRTGSDGAIRLSAVIALCVLAVLFLKEVRVEAAALPVQECAATLASNEVWEMPPASVQSAESEYGSMAEDLRAQSNVLGQRRQMRHDTEESLQRPVETPERPASVPTVSSATPEVVPTVPAFSREPTVKEPAVSVAQAPAPLDTKASARVAISANNFTEALALLARSSPRLSEDPEHYALLSVVLLALGEFDEAAEVYAALLSRDPNDARTWAGLAICQARLGRSRQSIDAYREASRLALGDPGVLRVVESGLAGMG